MKKCSAALSLQQAQVRHILILSKFSKCRDLKHVYMITFAGMQKTSWPACTAPSTKVKKCTWCCICFISKNLHQLIVVCNYGLLLILLFFMQAGDCMMSSSWLIYELMQSTSKKSFLHIISNDVEIGMHQDTSLTVNYPLNLRSNKFWGTLKLQFTHYLICTMQYFIPI